MSEPVHKCPECRNPSTPKYRPFCSKRCADIDLGRWLKGGYVISGGNSDADEDGERSAETPLMQESGEGAED